MSRERALALGAVAISSILWGTTGTAATFAPGAGPLAIGAFALGIGGILQALVAIPALRAARSQLRRNRPTVVLGALAVAVYPLAFYSSMHLAGVALGVVASLASAPLASGVIERIVERTPLSPWWLSAAGLGIVGSALLCFSKLTSAPEELAATLLGIGLGLVAGTTYAVYSWCAQRLMVSGVSRSASMGAIFGWGGTLLLPVVCVTGAPLIAGLPTLSVALYMALVPMFLGYLLFGYGLARLPVSTVTTLTLSEPAITTVLAVLVVGERLSLLGWSGLGLIALSLVVLVCAPASQVSRPGRAPTPRTAEQPVSS
ncbi:MULTISPECIES: DMT family transporter [unclassified Leucobacter]|uniref:DMT family transporter n=1 Tax=unclassified Leucobacter TaxID=2621730 RepID=UPI00165DAA80|nr:MULTISPECIES: EamA family transporter [unclassified Leucobacter]MBC9935458.1 EamA family transporter [Leucobacter sp. cx-87]